MLFIVGKKIREDVESRKPRSLNTRHDSILFCSNFCIKQMVSFNFYLFFTKIVILPGISYCVWLIVVTSQFSRVWNFFFKTWDDPLCNPAERVRIVGIKGNYCALVYFLYLKHCAYTGMYSWNLWCQLLYCTATLETFLYGNYVFDTSSGILCSFCFVVLMTKIWFLKMYLVLQLKDVSLSTSLKFVMIKRKMCMLVTQEDLGVCVKNYLLRRSNLFSLWL